VVDRRHIARHDVNDSMRTRLIQTMDVHGMPFTHMPNPNLNEEELIDETISAPREMKSWF
jgi:hypothetical protein